MRERIEALDTCGGHILVAFSIFAIGVAMVACKVPKGEEVIVGALASLWTSLTPGTRKKEEK
jgi:hypothetical protein